MSKRMRSAWITVAVLAASALTVGAAEARSSHKSHGASGTSRACLTSAARGLLSRIEQRFGAMQIVSTCRPGARIRGTGRMSRHASGNAIDFNAGSRKGAVVQWLIANHRSGGTMTYAGMSHIHVDIGHHFVSLGSGGRSRVASRGKWSSSRMSLGRTQSRSERRRAYSGDESEGSSVSERRMDGRKVVHGISEPSG
jgi:hypothetical protein